MYICPSCYRIFKDENYIAKHYLQCWKAHNPNHQSQPAPCKGNTTDRQINTDVENFFSQFKKG